MKQKEGMDEQALLRGAEIISCSAGVAADVGLPAAMVLHCIVFWVRHNAANKTNYYDGKYWTYNSVRAWHELIWYMSERQINKALKKLEEAGYIEIGCYNKMPADRTQWYTITDKVCRYYPIPASGKTEKQRTDKCRARADEISDDVQMVIDTWNGHKTLVPIYLPRLGRIKSIQAAIDVYGVDRLIRIIDIYATANDGWYARNDHTNSIAWLLGRNKDTGVDNIERFVGLDAKAQRQEQAEAEEDAAMSTRPTGWREALIISGVLSMSGEFDEDGWADVKDSFTAAEQDEIEREFIRR